jgi:polyphosphate glucokinase
LLLVDELPALYLSRTVQLHSSDIESRVVIASRPRTLALVISPAEIEGVILGPTGTQIGWPTRLPRTADPTTAFADLWSKLEILGEFDRVAVMTKPNLGDGWELDALTRELERQCGRRVRATALDDLRWRHLIRRAGVELALVIGDELESALFFNGVLVPGLAVGRHRFRKGRTYSEYLAPRVRERKGEKAWHRRLERVVAEILAVWNPARLYLAAEAQVTLDDPRIVIATVPSAFERALTLWN